MGLLNDIDTLAKEIEEKEKEFFGTAAADVIQAANDKNFRFKLMGKSIGKVVAFAVLPAGEVGYTHLQMTFTDRGLYFYNGQLILGGTNATYKGYAVPQVQPDMPQLIFYGQGDGMSVAETKPQRTSSTWLTEGVAGLQANLTGAGTYRGSILYRWAPGPFAAVNPRPAIFQLIINDFGFTFGTIYRWLDPNEDAGEASVSATSDTSASDGGTQTIGSAW